MAQVKVEINDKELEAAAKAKITALRRENRRLEDQLVKKDQEIRKLNLQLRQVSYKEHRYDELRQTLKEILDLVEY